MTDVEPMLRQAILQGTDSPAPTDLVQRVHERGRARRRRTRGITAGLAAAAVAVVAVATAQLAGPDRAGTPSTSESPSPTPTETAAAVDPAWRWESWHDVQVQVPADWVYGSRGQWCTMSGRTDGWRVPRVWRGDQPETKVRCPDPVESYGLTFFDTTLLDVGWKQGKIVQLSDGNSGPVGAWYSIVLKSDVGMRIAAPDRETVQHIIESADRFRTHADNNGCFFTDGRNYRVEPEPGTVSVCRYADGFWLQQSERLEGADAEAAIAALDSAPVIDYQPCPVQKVPPPSIELVTTEGVADIQWSSLCTGVYWKDRLREITPDVMYWALSPGFAGGLPGDVPVPSTLRG